MNPIHTLDHDQCGALASISLKIRFTAAARFITTRDEAWQGVNLSGKVRRPVVVDIENVVGGAVQTVEAVSRAAELLREALGLTRDEPVVIGTSHYGMLSTALGWDGPRRLVMRSGPDGADLALLEVLTEERVEERFEEVALAFGDGIFAETLAALAKSGVRTTVVARAGHCSARLRLAAFKTVLLSADIDSVGGAA